MRTRIILFSIGILFIGVIETQSQWQIERCPVEDDLNSIFLISETQKWIVGNNGVILNYTNGFWNNVSSPTKNHLLSIFMNNEIEGWAVGSKGTILHYQDNKWNLVESPTRANLNDVKFINSNHGLAVGEFGTIIEYNNGQWSLLPNLSYANLNGLDYNQFEFWIGGALESVNVPIYRFSSDLLTLSKKSYSNFFPVQDLAILENGTGWAVGNKNTLLCFDGSSWETVSLNFHFPSLKSVFFNNHDVGICVGYEGTILEYRNNYWEKVESGIKMTLNSVSSIDRIAYAVGNKGTILSTAFFAAEPDISLKIEQFEIFPIPTDVQLRVNFEFSGENAPVLLSIHDIHGKLIREVEFMAIQGRNSYLLNTADIDDGIYFLKLQKDLVSENRKLVIQHR